ncbi:alpha/beta hydrolase [Phytohabitans rumicis]|uniref:Putative lipase/esterase n=1 Tax=Phytohabitans rumicis TaxID=1076125 RepID=A0A6V8KVR8_9ACTN|nr:alpha/beta hydrolase [Phytohabitans rumicis]GFJ87934.1 putative lipase/esterase [Phytohabitans rumicis]
MPLHPQLLAMREQRRRDGTRPLYEQSLAEARAADLAAIKADRGAPYPVGEVVDLRVAGRLDARLYRPTGAGTKPVLVYFFGGGWVLGSLETSDGICRRLCADADCVVLSVAYRLAPEHPFPAAPLDCYAAVRWAASHVDGFGGDPARISVAGDSAGGNLAAAVTLQARAGGPALASQVLVYPNVEYGADTPSMRDNTDPSFFNRTSVGWYWGHYLARPEDGADPLASPLRAGDLSGLPPALIITAEYDPLRDEGERYADRLRAAGVPVELERYDGMTHGFFTMTGALVEARTATARVAEYLRKSWARAVKQYRP